MEGAGGGRAEVLSVVVPAWNESAGIEHLIAAALREADSFVANPRFGIDDFELVIVDDGSTDGTLEILETAQRKDSRIVIVRHPRNRGLGAALRSGITAARGDLVLYTDADLPVDFAELDRLLAIYRRSEAVLVSAKRVGGESEGARRRLYTGVYDWLVNTAFGLSIDDVNFAFKLFDRRVVRRLNLRSEGSFIDAELLARLHQSGHRIDQAEVQYHPRRWGSSSLSSPSVIAHILWEMSRQIRGIRRRPKTGPICVPEVNFESRATSRYG